MKALPNVSIAQSPDYAFVCAISRNHTQYYGIARFTYHDNSSPMMDCYLPSIFGLQFLMSILALEDWQPYGVDLVDFLDGHQLARTSVDELIAGYNVRERTKKQAASMGFTEIA